MSRFSFSATTKKSSPLKRLVLSVAFFVALFLFFLYATGSLSEGSVQRQKESLQNALSRNIIYHYAFTGSYPGSLQEIKDLYGLTYDENLFYVDYTVRGQNIMPEVTIIERAQSK